MNLEDYQTVFTVTILGLILVAASPTISLYLPSGGEQFSELWVLGPDHMAEDYPFNVVIDEEYRVFVGVSCHMGKSTYYMVYVKFRNQTQPLSNASASVPSSLPPLYEFQVFIEDGRIWETQLNFTILDVSVGTNSTLVGHLAVNDVVFEVNCTATWDSEYEGFFYQLFFELWMYDDAVSNFQYHDRFVGVWLNMTF
jgi:uncharacterized membrane protein